MKITSRKFIITMYWLAFGAVCTFMKYDPSTALIVVMGLVSIIYIGGNVVQKFIVPTLGAMKKEQ